jgi:hypothetical protein
MSRLWSRRHKERNFHFSWFKERLESKDKSFKKRLESNEEAQGQILQGEIGIKGRSIKDKSKNRRANIGDEKIFLSCEFAAILLPCQSSSWCVAALSHCAGHQSATKSS